MKVYVAGPMRGVPEFNFPAFNAAAAQLRALGHEVFNPAERDIEKYGKGVNNAAGDMGQAVREVNFSLRDALGADLAWICAEADAIALLPGWANSQGATAEAFTGVALGLTVQALDRFTG
jgi:hypothetical protein